MCVGRGGGLQHGLLGKNGRQPSGVQRRPVCHGLPSEAAAGGLR